MAYNKEAYKAYYERNKERIAARNKKSRTAHPNQNIYTNTWRNKNPWVKFLYAIRQRCNNAKHISYQGLGGQGIRCLLSREEIKGLWFRDKANGMQNPRLVRIHNNQDFTLDNCKFVDTACFGGKGSTKEVIITQKHYDDLNKIHPQQELTPPWVAAL